MRVVRSPAGVLSVDLKGKAPGRGAYLCAETDCLARGAREEALGRALETAIDDTAMNRLREEIERAATIRRGG